MLLFLNSRLVLGKVTSISSQQMGKEMDRHRQVRHGVRLAARIGGRGE